MESKFIGLIRSQAIRYGNREVFRYRDYLSGEWTSMSWHDFSLCADRAAAALCALGVNEEGNVAIFTNNCPEIMITHFASFYNRAVPVPIYATSSADEAAYIVNDCGARVIFAGDQRQCDIAVELLNRCASLQHVVALNPSVMLPSGAAVMRWDDFLALGEKADAKTFAEVKRRSEKSQDTDLMYLIYTSGTTGEPKGVMLTHSNFWSAMENHAMRIQVDSETDQSLCFLPLSHIFELGWTMFCLIQGVRVAINYDPKDIQRSVKEIRPTCMCSVPRFWEKVYTAINDNFDHAKPVLRMLVHRAVKVGKARLNYQRQGKKAPLLIEKQYQYFEKKVFSRLRRAIGIERNTLFPTAGAMLSDNITEFLRAVGIRIVIGYGLSETNATVCFYPDEGWQLGTVGTPLPEVKVKIGTDNEILVKGPTVMQGYYNKPVETALALDAQGWFHTGDCGEITPDGHIILTERLKDLYKTSNGKYIAPQMLETLLGQDKFVEQVAIIGDGRKYVSALIVPNFDEIKAYARSNKIAFQSVEDLVNSHELHQMLEARFDEYQRNLASYEQIKRFVILPRAFTMESGELTNTLKIRRSVINKRYAKLIDAMYAADFRKKN